MTDDELQRLADAIRAKGGDCTAAESFIPGLVDELLEFRRKASPEYSGSEWGESPPDKGDQARSRALRRWIEGERGEAWPLRS